MALESLGVLDLALDVFRSKTFKLENIKKKQILNQIPFTNWCSAFCKLLQGSE